MKQIICKLCKMFVKYLLKFLEPKIYVFVIVISCNRKGLQDFLCLSFEICCAFYRY